MADDLPADYYAKLMSNLDEHERDLLIFHGEMTGKVYDARDMFERASLDGLEVTMPHPWHPLDCDDYE